MQHDEVIWQAIRHNHCSFMTKIETGIFCRNPYNVTGRCERSSCPLANSRCATIQEHDGVFYLLMKTIERAHMPNKLWEKVKLPRNFDEALEIIDKHLMYWPESWLKKTKLRLYRMTQMRARTRKIALKTREKIMTVPTKQRKIEERRLEKAEKAAALEKSIENELLERLKRGVYPCVKIPNAEVEVEKEEEPVVEFVEGYEGFEEDDDMEDFGGLAFGYDDDDYNAEVDNDEEDEEEETVFIHRKRGKTCLVRKVDNEKPVTKFKKKVKVHVEVEHEDAVERRTAMD